MSLQDIQDTLVVQKFITSYLEKNIEQRMLC
jgi:hypothetical protein